MIDFRLSIKIIHSQAICQPLQKKFNHKEYMTILMIWFQHAAALGQRVNRTAR